VRVNRYFRFRGLDAATAEELTQNVMLKVYRRAGELRDVERFHGWLFAIARNEMVSYWRGAQVRIETVALEAAAGEQMVAAHDLSSGLQLTEWLRALEPAERDLVLLRFVEGLSYEELAGALDLPLGTVKWRIFNARKKLVRIITAPGTERKRQPIN